MRALLVLLLVAPMLAGCSGSGGKSGDTPTIITDPGQLETGKGAIAGLLIDDRYRPLTGGLVLLQPLGLTATSDANGEFQFVNLEPGQYTARATLEGHEAAPQPIRVVEGKFAELNLEARRVFSQDGRIITNEFSVFIPCAAGFVANGITLNCVGDLSGDSFRSSFSTNLTGESNITYMVTEWKFNQAGEWNVQIREDNGSPSGGERYAVQDVHGSDYARVVLQKGVLNEADNAQRNNVVWNNTKIFATGIFLNGDYKDDAQGVGDQACSASQGTYCPTYTGVGAGTGIRAQIVQTVFIGAPDVDVASYAVLAPSA